MCTQTFVNSGISILSSRALFLIVWLLSQAGFLLLVAKLAAVTIPQLASEKRATSLFLSKHHILQKDYLGHMTTLGPLTRLGLGHMPGPVAGPEGPLIDSPHEPLEVGAHSHKAKNCAVTRRDCSPGRQMQSLSIRVKTLL